MTDQQAPTSAQVERAFIFALSWGIFDEADVGPREDEHPEEAGLRWREAYDAKKRAEWEVERGEPEWEYGVMTKIGPLASASQEYAEDYARLIREEIVQGKSSGDLRYHGKVVRRSKEAAGPWLPVPVSTQPESEKP